MTVPPEGRADFHGESIGTAVGHHNTINIHYHNGEVRTVEVFRLLEPIQETRMRAEDWKSLHEEFQQISMRLVFVRRAVANEDLGTLEEHWSHDCRDKIQRFVALERFPEEMQVRRYLLTKNEENRYLDSIKSYASALDGIIGECKEPEDIRIRLREILAILLRLEQVSGLILSFLDGQLQSVIRELRERIKDAQSCLAEPPISTPPKATS